VAVFTRKSSVHLPGAAQEVARRRQREHYRKLAHTDAALARSINVGRPDLERDFNDGGLLDLNSLSAEALSHFGPMPVDEAQRIVAARQRTGRFTSVQNVAHSAALPDSTVVRLQERAIFL
jgi:DNA uptake protein ComE-like DNA-binding protein